MLQKPKVVVILGATATGKSHCAIEIAKQFQGEIISGDSMLVYKNMNIGTAKPTAEELYRIIWWIFCRRMHPSALWILRSVQLR